MVISIPQRESASRVRSIAVHGLNGTANVSAVCSAVLLTNADPDAVKGALCLQHMHCPAIIHDITRRTLALVVRHVGDFSEPVWGARHRAWTARANSRPWIPAASRGARNPRTLITGSGGRLAVSGRVG